MSKRQLALLQNDWGTLLNFEGGILLKFQKPLWEDIATKRKHLPKSTAGDLSLS